VDTDLDESIRSAIANRRLVQFTFDGKPRVVEPHDYGILAGVRTLFGLQVRGESSSRLPGWRPFATDRIKDLVALTETFAGSRGHEHTRHKKWDEVFARVA
jgi:hypothetical protein